MNRPSRVLLVVAVCLALLTVHPLSSQAAPVGPQTSRIYLKLSGISGGSVEEGHVGEIDALSFNWSANHSGQKLEMHDALILKSIDVATPKLMTACVSGQKIPEAVITAHGLVGGKEDDFLTYTFSDVVISVVSHTVINGAQEQVQFRYGSVKITYKSPDGKTTEETWKGDETK